MRGKEPLFPERAGEWHGWWFGVGLHVRGKESVATGRRPGRLGLSLCNPFAPLLGSALRLRREEGEGVDAADERSKSLGDSSSKKAAAGEPSRSTRAHRERMVCRCTRTTASRSATAWLS
eukprot:RCo038926